MSSTTEEPKGGRPTAAKLYVASIVASAIGFLLILSLLSLAAFLSETAPGGLGMFIIIGFYGAFVAALISLFFTGPIGMGIGLFLIRMDIPPRWLGAANGALTALSLSVIWIVFTGSLTGSFNGEDIAYAARFVLGLVTTGIFAGWATQRYYLMWPTPEA